MIKLTSSDSVLCDQLSYDRHAKAWVSSGLSQLKYCELHNLKYSWLVAARSRLVNPANNKQKGFIPLVSRASEPSTRSISPFASKIILRFAAGSICELPSDLPPEQMKSIFTALSANP